MRCVGVTLMPDLLVNNHTILLMKYAVEVGVVEVK